MPLVNPNLRALIAMCCRLVLSIRCICLTCISSIAQQLGSYCLILHSSNDHPVTCCSSVLLQNIDWKKMAEREVQPPIKPKEEKNATPDAAIADAFQDEEPKQ